MSRRHAVVALLSAATLSSFVPACAEGGEPPVGGDLALAAVVQVSTPTANGSGFMIEGGYVVTAAHVVVPHDDVGVRFESGERFDEVEVVGVDLVRDVALLGPVETDVAPLEVRPAEGLERGEPLYVAGFPFEFGENEAEVALSLGVLSRRSHDTTFDLTYVHSDASSGPGGSGGALLAEDGDVVAIDVVGLGEDFTVGLDGSQVRDAVTRLQDGGGDAVATWSEVSREGELTVPVPTDSAAVVLLDPPAPGAALTFSLSDPTLPVAVGTLAGDQCFFNEANASSATGQVLSLSPRGVEPFVACDPLVTTPDGWTIADLDDRAGALVVTVAGPADGSAAQVELSASTTARLGAPSEVAELAPVDEVDGVLQLSEDRDTYELALGEGEDVELSLEAPLGSDPYLVVEHADGTRERFDGSTGFSGRGVRQRFTAPADGVYRFHVYSAGDLAMAYRLSAAPV